MVAVDRVHAHCRRRLVRWREVGDVLLELVVVVVDGDGRGGSVCCRRVLLLLLNGGQHGLSVRVRVEQQQRLEVSSPALVHDARPRPAHFLHARVVKVDPQLQLRVEEERRVVFAVVGDEADEVVRRPRRPLLVPRA